MAEKGLKVAIYGQNGHKWHVDVRQIEAYVRLRPQKPQMAVKSGRKDVKTAKSRTWPIRVRTIGELTHF